MTRHLHNKMLDWLILTKFHKINHKKAAKLRELWNFYKDRNKILIA